VPPANVPSAAHRVSNPQALGSPAGPLPRRSQSMRGPRCWRRPRRLRRPLPRALPVSSRLPARGPRCRRHMGCLLLRNGQPHPLRLSPSGRPLSAVRRHMPVSSGVPTPAGTYLPEGKKVCGLSRPATKNPAWNIDNALVALPDSFRGKYVACSTLMEANWTHPVAHCIKNKCTVPMEVDHTQWQKPVGTCFNCYTRLVRARHGASRAYSHPHRESPSGPSHRPRSARPKSTSTPSPMATTSAPACR
jgi:hypothetical protein